MYISGTHSHKGTKAWAGPSLQVVPPQTGSFSDDEGWKTVSGLTPIHEGLGNPLLGHGDTEAQTAGHGKRDLIIRG